jgi:hypothetical protein
MIFDGNLRLMTASAPVNSSGTVSYPAVNSHSYSSDYIDLSVARDIGEGRQLYAHIHVTESFAGTGAVLAISFVTAGQYAESTVNTVVAGSIGLCQPATASGANLTQLIAGQKYIVPLSLSTVNNGFRYLYAVFTGLGAGAMTQGKMTIDIVQDIQTASTAAANCYPSAVSFP